MSSVHTKLMAILLWPTVSITSGSVGFFGILDRHVARRSGRRPGRVAFCRLRDRALRVRRIRVSSATQRKRQQCSDQHLREQFCVSSHCFQSFRFGDAVLGSRGHTSSGHATSAQSIRFVGSSPRVR